ncbi:FAD-binding oxidoreductase [Candidatus Avelusimicrobium sp.]
MQISARVLKRLKNLLGKQNVLTDEVSLSLNGYDCSQTKHRPDVLLHISQTAQLLPAVQILTQEKIPFVVRAAATNHAGSCSAVRGGAVININKLDKIRRIDTARLFAEVEPGVVTAQLQEELAPLNFFYPPDPASEKVCTLAGNLAQNASGARCMKYGNTTDNTLQVQFITPQAERLALSHEQAGPDWLGLIGGSEGTLGVIESLQVKIVPTPKCVKTFLTTFPSLECAVQAVTDLVARGLIPRCVEAMDHTTTCAVENFAQAGYPTDAQALLIIELDADTQQIKKDALLLEEICQRNQCLRFTAAHTENERQKLWSGRRAAYSAMTALGPNIAVADATTPRSVLPQALKQVQQIIAKYGITASLLFHAGDGNFHPQIVFNAAQKEQTLLVNKALQEILKTCVDFGGTISGEHGVGVEKRAAMAYQYDQSTLRLFQQIKKAFDPHNLANPGKIIPLSYTQTARHHLEQNPEVLALSEEIKTRHRLGKTSLICGSNTLLKTQKPTLSAKHLNRILDIDKTNYTATAQTGVKVADLIAALQAQNVYAKLPQDYSGTLGGLTASKICPLFTDQLIGLQAILPNGDFVNYGGKLMKNAAGYNLCRLFVGSAGALGLITKLTFKIYAQPQAVKPLEDFVFAPADILLRRVKKEIDPQGLFLSAMFENNL